MTAQTRQIDPEVLEILRDTELDPESMAIVITSGQLSRELYVKVDKTLKLYNGKWNRKLKGHVFPNASDIRGLKEAIGSGRSTDAKKNLQAFYTPPDLARYVTERACVSGMTVAEPSAGVGALASECEAQGAKSVVCYEIDENASVELRKRWTTVTGDFLTTPFVENFDRVVMNPPFKNNQDCKHVQKALGMLKPNGVLVAIMWPNKTRVQFVNLTNDWRAAGGRVEIEEIEAGRFKESGTMVATMMVTFRNT
jgi:predicted RNA methylase